MFSITASSEEVSWLRVARSAVGQWCW